jgi:hypothetical protein
MSGSRRAPLVVAATLALAAGCGGGPARTDLRVDIWNGGGTYMPTRPTTVTLSWLDNYGFLFKNRLFAVPPGTQGYLGSVDVRAYVADLTTARRALVRGQLDGRDISEGWGSFVPVDGQPNPPIEVNLQALSDDGTDPFDTDGDGIPDAIDNCPSIPNPDQTTGC